MELPSVPLSTTRAVRPRRRASMAQARPTGPAPMTTTSRRSGGRSGIPLFYVVHLSELRLRPRQPALGQLVEHHRLGLVDLEEGGGMHLDADQHQPRIVGRAVPRIFPFGE